MDHETRGFFEHFAPKGAGIHLLAVIYKHSAPTERRLYQASREVTLAKCRF